MTLRVTAKFDAASNSPAVPVVKPPRGVITPSTCSYYLLALPGLESRSSYDGHTVTDDPMHQGLTGIVVYSPRAGI